MPYSKSSSQDRKLSAIMFSDIVGYTAIMQLDEEKAMSRLKRYQDVLKKCTKENKGEIIKSYGDGSLCLFDSVLNALNCAKSVQEELTKDPKVPLRIGLHLGDVTYREGDVYGNDINLASRIESMGVTGSVLMSSNFVDKVNNQPGLEFQTLGAHRFKNVEGKIELFALSNKGFAVPKPSEMKGKSIKKRNTYLHKSGIAIIGILLLLIIAYMNGFNFMSKDTNNSIDKNNLTIAVLPLLNLNSKKDNLEYFSDGLTQEIIYELAKINSISVTAFTTSMAYKSSDKPPDEIAQQLKVEYLVSGSARILDNGNRVKIVLELIDPQSKKVIWTETFDEDFNDVTTIQLAAVKNIASTLNVDQSTLEKLSFNTVNTKSGEAFRLFLQAKSEIYKMTPTGFENTRNLLDKALEIDSNYAQAHTLMAWNLILQGGSWFQGYNRSTKETVELALPHIKKSIELNPESSDIFLIRGNLNLHHRGLLKEAKKDIEYALKINSWPRIPTDYCICTVVATFSALGEMDRAKSLAILGAQVDPGNVFISFDQALIYMLEGRMKEAQDLLETSVKIVDIPYFNFYLGWSYYHDNQFEKALESLKKAYQFGDWSIAFNVAYLSNTYLMLGDQQNSDKYLKELIEREKSGENHVNLSLAMIYAARNNVEKTFEYLEVAELKREYAFAYMINTDLIFRPYYQYQKFTDLRNKVQFY